MPKYNITNNNKEVVDEWEYQITYLSGRTILDEEQILNVSGYVGWELIHVEKKTIKMGKGKPNIDEIKHYYKRPKIKKEK